MPTTISWVTNPDGTPGETWNPVGCSNTCPWRYARQLHTQRHRAGMKGYERPFTEPHPMPARLAQPLSWRKPKGVFVCSMGDLFDPAIPSEYIAAVFGVMAATPRHRYIVLTKQAERMEAWFAQTGECLYSIRHCLSAAIKAKVIDFGDLLAHAGRGWPLPNVWLGVSVTNQSDADERIPYLLQCPAARRFVSYESALGGIDFTRIRPPGGCGNPGCDDDELNAFRGDLSQCSHGYGTRGMLGGIDWLIMGPKNVGRVADPIPFDWAQSAYDQCRRAGVPFFWKPEDGRLPRRVPGDMA